MKSKPENIQQLIREQQRPNEVSIKLQSNLTETTHHDGAPLQILILLIDDNEKLHIYMYYISL